MEKIAWQKAGIFKVEQSSFTKCYKTDEMVIRQMLTLWYHIYFIQLFNGAQHLFDKCTPQRKKTARKIISDF